MYEPQVRTEISQGDIFDDVPIAYVAYSPDNLTPILNTRNVRAMMLTHDCEHDKPSNQWVIVAEIRPISEIAAQNQSLIRQYRVYNAFYLEALADVFSESYVDIRRIDRLDKRMLAERSQSGQKLASLNENARLALQRQIAVFFGLNRK